MNTVTPTTTVARRCHHTDPEVEESVRTARPRIEPADDETGWLSYAAAQSGRVTCGAWDWAANQGWVIPAGSIDRTWHLVDGGTRAVVQVARVGTALASTPPTARLTPMSELRPSRAILARAAVRCP